MVVQAQVGDRSTSCTSLAGPGVVEGGEMLQLEFVEVELPVSFSAVLDGISGREKFRELLSGWRLWDQRTRRD